MKKMRISRLFFCYFKLLFERIKEGTPVLFFVFFLLFGLAFFVKKSAVLIPTVLICNEDDSFLGRVLIKGILDEKLDEVIQFKEIGFEEGKKEMKAGLSECMLYLQKDTVNTLYRGEKATLQLFVRDTENDFVRFFVGYIKGFIEMINTSQNAGLAYMDLLYENGMKEDERETIFNEMQLKYSGKVLMRTEVVEKEKTQVLFSKKGLSFLFFLIFCFLVPLFFILKSEMTDHDLNERLSFCGYSRVEKGVALVLLAGIISICTFLVGIVFFIFTGIGG